MKRTILTLVVVFATACGGDDGGPIPIEQLGDRALSALCQHFASCGLYSSEAACKATVANANFYGDIIAGVKDGTVKYDGNLAGACMSAFQTLSCDPSAMINRVEPQACIDMFKGTVADAGMCKIDEQCVSQSCALTSCTMACCPGTCDMTPPAKAAIGSSCAMAPCVANAYCNNGTCAALLAAGATCADDSQCDFNLACIGASGSEKCTAVPKAGDACVTHNSAPQQCLSDGLTCDQAMSKCVAFGNSGAACGNGKPTCKQDLDCSAMSMTCGAAPAIGAACTGPCVGGAYCDSMTHTCAAWKANGATCQFGGECTSGYCDQTQKCAVVPVCG